MDDLSRDAREALRRYHAAAGLDRPAHGRVWQRIEDSLAHAEPQPTRRGRMLVLPISLALAAAAVFAICDVRGRLTDTRRVDTAAYEAAPGPVHASQPRAPTAPAPVVHEPPAPPPVRAAPRASAPPAATSEERGLAAEIAYMRQARAAIDGGDPEAALRALAEHAREFPAGQMLEDRQRLRIEATCALGRDEQARAQADEFLRAHPGSPHAARVRELCRKPELP